MLISNAAFNFNPISSNDDKNITYICYLFIIYFLNPVNYAIQPVGSKITCSNNKVIESDSHTKHNLVSASKNVKAFTNLSKRK